MQTPDLMLQAIFDHAAVGIAQGNVDGELLRVNNRYCQMLGYSEAELRTKTIQDITHPNDLDVTLTGYRQLLEGQISMHSMEKRYIRRDGTIFCARLNLSLVRDHDNRPKYFIAVVEDITEKIQAERALRDSEQRLTMAQNAAYLGVWDRDMRTDVITICGKYAELHGLSPDRTALRHEEWVSLIHPDDRERVHALRREAREHTHTFDAEFRVIWPEGSLHWLHAKGIVLLGESGRPIRSMGVIWEITERKQAEARLRESEERFRHMADSAPVMIWVSGLDKLCTFFNQPWLDFTGRTIEEELGNGWASGVHPEDLDRCLVTYNSSFDAGRSFKMEYRLRRADGEYHWVLDNGTPLYRGDEFVGFIGSCIDISEQKLIEERLRASEIQLLDAQRLAKLGSFERQIDTGRADWSDELRQILGVTRDAAAGFPAFINCVHPKDRERMLETECYVRATLAPVETEYRIIRPDGEVRLVRSVLEAIRNDQGAVVRIAGASQDVTEQVKAQELLGQSEKRLKNAEHLAHLGHWQWDLKTNQVILSEECFRIFGRPPNYTPASRVFSRHSCQKIGSGWSGRQDTAWRRRKEALSSFELSGPTVKCGQSGPFPRCYWMRRGSRLLSLVPVRTSLMKSERKKSLLPGRSSKAWER
jgi:PAS domain S-box-containing protein